MVGRVAFICVKYLFDMPENFLRTPYCAILARIPVLAGSMIALLVLAVCVMPQRTDRMVALTFDDLPLTGAAQDLGSVKRVNRRLLSTLRRFRAPAAGFVNEGKLVSSGEIDERLRILEAWLEHGHILGNHTYSHIAIARTGIEEYKADVIRGETLTRFILGRHGKKLRYFRHTQLRTGPTAEYRNQLQAFLRMRGYTIAPVTIDNNEYIFAAVYKRAMLAGDEKLKERVASAYISYMAEVFQHFEGLSRSFLGYEVRQVLLLHANELNADHLGELLRMLKKRGYRFVSLDAALEDRAYALPEATSKRGLSWIHRWMLARGQKMSPEPDVPKWVSALFTSGR